jgi:hypothetical protein
VRRYPPPNRRARLARLSYFWYRCYSSALGTVSDRWSRRAEIASHRGDSTLEIAGRKIIGVGAWRSLVAHLPWAQGVAGSNPVAPTIIFTSASSSGGLEQRPSKPRVMGSNPFWRATSGSARDRKMESALCDFRIFAKVRFGGECSSVGRALDCGSRCRGFNPLHSPHPFLLRSAARGAPLAQLVEQLTLNQRVPSSSLGRRTIESCRAIAGRLRL